MKSSIWRSCASMHAALHSNIRRPYFSSRRYLNYSRISETFQPLVPFISEPKTSDNDNKQDKRHSRSQKLLTETGMIFPAHPNGTFYLLPMFVRSLEKLIKIIDDEMRAAGCQKLIMPCINDAAPWKTSGRWEAFGHELIRFKDRNSKELCLGPVRNQYAKCMQFKQKDHYSLTAHSAARAVL